MTTVGKSKHTQAKPVIDLSSHDGNAHALMGHARRLARRLGLDESAILAEMTSGDYETLVNVFKREFGRAVIFLEDDTPDMECTR